MSQPTDCRAAFYLSLGCVVVTWTADPTTPEFSEIQREDNGVGNWVTLDDDIDAAATFFTDCDVRSAWTYRYRVRSHYAGEFVGDEEEIWTDDEEDIWLEGVSDWCATNPAHVFLVQVWTEPELEANYSIAARNTEGVLLGIVDAYDRLEYTRTLNAPGYLEITSSPLLVDSDWFELDYIVEVWRKAPGVDWREDFTALNRYRQFWYDGDDKEWFRAVGPGPEDLLRRRIILPTADEATLLMDAAFTDVMRELVRTQCGTSALTARQFEELSVEADTGDGDNLTYPYRYENLLEEIQVLADLGADFLVVHLGENLFEFRVYYPQYGVDRRVGNTEGNPPMVFSIEMANMTRPSFEDDRLVEMTVVYVGGEEAGAMREVVERSSLVSAELDSPWNRVESFLESRQETSLGALMAYGDAFLVEGREKITFTCQATPVVTSLYGVHWDLGDLVTGRYRGTDYDLQIVEIRVQVDDDGEHVFPTFEATRPAYTGPIYTTPYFA